jgi:hypothetical protein
MSRRTVRPKGSLEEAVNQYTYVVQTPSGRFFAYKSLSAARGAVTAHATTGWGRNAVVGPKDDYKIHKVRLEVADVEVLHG